MALNRDIENWNPEDTQFWESQGRRIAYRNLWISIPNLLMGFALWLMWGMITVQMMNLGFGFTELQMFTVTAIAGFTGATLRIPASFFIRIAGGRNTIFFSTALLMIPAFGAYFALQNPQTPLWVFQLLAFLSGIGGGNFACSMSNISTFFPRHQQGLALGLNAGPAHLLVRLPRHDRNHGRVAGGGLRHLDRAGACAGRCHGGRAGRRAHELHRLRACVYRLHHPGLRRRRRPGPGRHHADCHGVRYFQCRAVQPCSDLPTPRHRWCCRLDRWARRFRRHGVPPIMGFFVDWQGEQGYANGFIVFAGLSLTSIGIMILLRTTRGGVAAAVAAADERAAKKGATVSDAGPGDAAVQPENT